MAQPGTAHDEVFEVVIVASTSEEPVVQVVQPSEEPVVQVVQPSEEPVVQLVNAYDTALFRSDCRSLVSRGIFKSL